MMEFRMEKGINNSRIVVLTSIDNKFMIEAHPDGKYDALVRIPAPKLTDDCDRYYHPMVTTTDFFRCLELVENHGKNNIYINLTELQFNEYGDPNWDIIKLTDYPNFEIYCKEKYYELCKLDEVDSKFKATGFRFLSLEPAVTFIKLVNEDPCFLHGSNAEEIYRELGVKDEEIHYE